MNESDDRNAESSDDAVLAAARALPGGIAPNRDLWPGIARGIARGIVEEAGEADGRSGDGHAAWQARGGLPRWQRVLGYAAAVVLLVGGSSGITWLAATGGQSAVVPQQAFEPLQLQPVSGSFGAQHELGPDFMAARNSLASQLDSKLDRLSPEARAEVERNIAEIRASIHQIDSVLADEPDNALLQELLLSAYRDELRIMRRVDGLITSVMRREDI